MDAYLRERAEYEISLNMFSIDFPTVVPKVHW